MVALSRERVLVQLTSKETKINPTDYGRIYFYFQNNLCLNILRNNKRSTVAACQHHISFRVVGKLLVIAHKI